MVRLIKLSMRIVFILSRFLGNLLNDIFLVTLRKSSNKSKEDTLGGWYSVNQSSSILWWLSSWRYGGCVTWSFEAEQPRSNWTRPAGSSKVNTRGFWYFQRIKKSRLEMVVIIHFPLLIYCGIGNILQGITSVWHCSLSRCSTLLKNAMIHFLLK